MDLSVARLGLLKSTLVNFPGKLSMAVFLPGCNLRCGYCHNWELALADSLGTSLARASTSATNEYFSFDEVVSYLRKRRAVISALVVSGGEPLVSPILPEILKVARDLEFQVKLDMNGLFPDRLMDILFSPLGSCISFVALDLKTSPKRYGELAINGSSLTGAMAFERLTKTISLLQGLEGEGRLQVEYRTVLAPSLVGLEEIAEIAKLLPSSADWKFAPFIQGHCLDPGFNDITNYCEEELASLVALAKSFIPAAQLR